MKKSDYKKGDEVELEMMNVILKIPKNAARLKIIVHLFDEDGEAMEVKSTMEASGIFDARKDFLDNVEDGDEYDAMYVLTNSGRELLAAIERGDEDALRELRELEEILRSEDEE